VSWKLTMPRRVLVELPMDVWTSLAVSLRAKGPFMITTFRLGDKHWRRRIQLRGGLIPRRRARRRPEEL
jgi:hypothetical protein